MELIKSAEMLNETSWICFNTLLNNYEITNLKDKKSSDLLEEPFDLEKLKPITNR